MIDYTIVKKTKTRIPYKGIDPEILQTIRWYPKVYDNPFKFDFDKVKERMELLEQQDTKTMYQQ